MLNPIYIIAIVFLVLGGAFGGYVVYHKEAVMTPLINAEKAAIEEMSCDEIKLKHEGGQYWSFKNWRLGDDKVKSCTPPT